MIYQVTIKGIEPGLLQNRPWELLKDLPGEGGGIKEKKPITNKPLAEAAPKLYTTPDGKIYQPAEHIRCALIEGGKAFKVKGGKGRATYSKIIGYAVRIVPEALIHKNQKWIVDSRFEVNPSTGGWVMIHRPLFQEWELDFEIDFEEEEIDAIALKEVLDKTGRTVGIGDYSPAKKGPFGQFIVTSYKNLFVTLINV